MKSDPIVEEVRETRRKLMEKFGNDPRRYWEHLRERSVQHPDAYLTPEGLEHARRAVAETRVPYGKPARQKGTE